MVLPVFALLLGLVLLVWSADRFVDGSASTAIHFHVPPLLIGMLIVGFGTSAPEMVVSALAAFDGSPGIAIGNAYGSNIANIALILGVTALISPVIVHSTVLRKELPVLTLVTFVSIALLADLNVTRLDALVLLAIFSVLIAWSIFLGRRQMSSFVEKEVEKGMAEKTMPLKQALFWLVGGLVVLIASSRILVWGAVELAQIFGVSDIVIGLTVIAIGTSLPELASSVIAARKGEHDIALGNVLGSNLFNTLAVVGIAGIIRPFEVGAEVLHRDMLVMTVLTLSLFVFGYGIRKQQGRINRIKGALLLSCYLGYTAYLIATILAEKI